MLGDSDMHMDRRFWTAGLFAMICCAVRLYFNVLEVQGKISHLNVVKLFTHSKHITERRKEILQMLIIFLLNLFEAKI